MLQRILLTGVVSLGVLMAHALPAAAQEKKGICEFGANDQKLTGAKRKQFMSKCMARDDAAPKARKKKKKEG